MGKKEKKRSSHSFPHISSGVGPMSWDRRGSGNAGNDKPSTTAGQVEMYTAENGEKVYIEPYDLWKAREKRAQQSLPRKKWTNLSAVQSYLASLKR